jgi:hypothetical protein
MASGFARLRSQPEVSAQRGGDAEEREGRYPNDFVGQQFCRGIDRNTVHSVPPAFYKLPRMATADMANRTGSTGEWAGVGSICGLYAFIQS